MKRKSNSKISFALLIFLIGKTMLDCVFTTCLHQNFKFLVTWLHFLADSITNWKKIIFGVIGAKYQPLSSLVDLHRLEAYTYEINEEDHKKSEMVLMVSSHAFFVMKLQRTCSHNHSIRSFGFLLMLKKNIFV